MGNVLNYPKLENFNAPPISRNLGLMRNSEGVEEVLQSVKCLPTKREGQSWILSTVKKAGVLTATCQVTWRCREGQIPGLLIAHPSQTSKRRVPGRDLVSKPNIDGSRGMTWRLIAGLHKHGHSCSGPCSPHPLPHKHIPAPTIYTKDWSIKTVEDSGFL